jgi:hypothetical protein
MQVPGIRAPWRQTNAAHQQIATEGTNNETFQPARTPIDIVATIFRWIATYQPRLEMTRSLREELAEALPTQPFQNTSRSL